MILEAGYYAACLQDANSMFYYVNTFPALLTSQVDYSSYKRRGTLALLLPHHYGETSAPDKMGRHFYASANSRFLPGLIQVCRPTILPS